MTNPSSWLEVAIGNLINFKDIAYYMLAGFAIGGAGLGVIGSNLFIRATSRCNFIAVYSIVLERKCDAP